MFPRSLGVEEDEGWGEGSRTSSISRSPSPGILLVGEEVRAGRWEWQGRRPAWK